ncbi:PAS domain S-box-containing protein/diguanylate cyclase (GGDEF)-like protein [Tumebacillus permanentifrigoris]|uniref:PAS domain S-box-containing protein/diguanylate cyclase (GGDEF)-like protein n=2 Tax=Tumebacillus permanentifrigoris TaxID=378543 RepID=A0A316DDE4_9BACL|nr:PAS domain S-box-containing protein/diguanylate cyclase (GGDEF)-like protein [Tumebacillus permanentifrigoris]
MFGTLCALDPEPYKFSEREIESMSYLAKFLGHAFELQKMTANLQLKSAALESTANAVAITDRQGQVQWVNPAFTRMTGYTLGEATNQKISAIMEQHDLLLTHQYWEGEAPSRRKDGSLYHLETKITPVQNEDGEITHFISVQEDVTERKLSEAKLHYLAHFDPLTELPNRVRFRESLTEELLHAKQQDQQLALMFLDLDRFKTINDTLGHSLGDQLLRLVAMRIRECARSQDLVSRITGDGFTVIMPNVAGLAEVEEIATKIAEGINEPFTVEGYELFISTSIGISLYPENGPDAESLLRFADTAMYYAKETGRDSYCIYSDEMSLHNMLEVETALRRVLERDELTLHYQPKVDIHTGEIYGMEALLRWFHPTLGFVPPDVFIPLAEEIGMIGKLGEWVLHTACEQNRRWQEQGLPPLRCAVNLSVGQFQYTNLVETVRQVLLDTQLDGRWLELEVTESIIIQDTEKVIDMLLELKEFGIEISIDDFGTGYSSLRYLQRLPIDTLKIDRSFVKDIDSPEADEAAIARAVILLAHSLGLRVIAEGVETEVQLDFLRSENCDAIQGYLFSRPVPAEQFAELVRSQKRLPVRLDVI